MSWTNCDTLVQLSRLSSIILQTESTEKNCHQNHLLQTADKPVFRVVGNICNPKLILFFFCVLLLLTKQPQLRGCVHYEEGPWGLLSVPKVGVRPSLNSQVHRILLWEGYEIITEPSGFLREPAI
ncbi:hypothetical protein J6590_029682 [Homalodisca vitripennis]|nr:hypothetical protein J6590_029682 [Homalodisca vitripennis]